MSDTGWIMLHRQITECWVWDDDEPYTKGQAWIYLLLCANHADAKIYLDGRLEIVKRGQYVTSIRKLAEKFSWSRDKVSKFLKLLEQDNMIIKNTDTKKTLLTIVNYGKYQSFPNNKQTPNGHETDAEQTPNGQQTDSTNATERTPTDTNNNDNNDNNDNNENNENNIPPISPQGEEWDYSKNSNVENAKHILNAGLYAESDYIKDNDLWEIIKDWLEYKDDKKPKNKNHYVNDKSIKSLFSEIIGKAKQHGREPTIKAIEHSMAQTWQGISWDGIEKYKTETPKTNKWGW